MNIKFRTKRQFDAVLRKEGKVITDYLSGEEHRVFFRLMKHSDNTSSKLRLYYQKDLNISRGTIFTLYNEQYLVVNKDSVESEIYNTSVAVRCTQRFLCGATQLPFVVSDLKNVYPTGGSVMSIIGGSITVYTGDNEFFRSVNIDDTYVAFGGTYKVINTFYNDGLGYLYLSRYASATTYSLEYTGEISLKYEDNTYQLTYAAYKGSAVVSDATLTYSTSDDTIAIVSDTGVLTMLSDGEVNVTAVWTEQNVTCETTLNITKQTQDDTYICTIQGRSDVKVGTRRTVTAQVIKNETEDVTAGSTITWSISNFSSGITASDISITPNGSSCTLIVEDEDIADETFTLTATAVVDSNTVSGTMDMTVTGIWG